MEERGKCWKETQIRKPLLGESKVKGPRGKMYDEGIEGRIRDPNEELNKAEFWS